MGQELSDKIVESGVRKNGPASAAEVKDEVDELEIANVAPTEFAESFDTGISAAFRLSHRLEASRQGGLRDS